MRLYMISTDRWNKVRQGYKKLIDTLNSCETWDHFHCWENMITNYLEWMSYLLDQEDTLLNKWISKQHRSRMEEGKWIYNDLMDKRKKFYNITKKYESEQKKKQKELKETPVVVKGFTFDAVKKKRASAKNKKSL